MLTDPKEGCIKSYDEIDAVGHRLVHGGDKFSQSVIIDEAVKEKMRECYDIAPLHNPANMIGIEAITAIMPDVPQVGVFDTAFHQTMPPKAYMYALPYKYYTEDGVRRYGFHGTSHRYVSQRVCEFLGVDNKTSSASSHATSATALLWLLLWAASALTHRWASPLSKAL